MSLNFRGSYQALEDDDESETITEQWRQTLTGLFESAQMAKKSFGQRVFTEKVKNIMYGGLDGVITTFAIVCAGIGMHLTDKEIFVVALASLFADAFSMGYGDFVSSKMQRNYFKQEYKKGQRRFKLNRDREIVKLTDLLTARGLDYEDARLVSSTFSTYEDIFLNEVTRLKLDVEDPGTIRDIASGAFATFVSFIIVGGIPIIIFICADLNKHSKNAKIPLFSCLCAFMLFILGAVCAHYTKQGRIFRGVETMLYGTTAAAVAYGIANWANA